MTSTVQNFGTGICVDVHTHLTDAKFNASTLGDVIAKAKEKGVKAALVVSESIADFEPVLRLQRLYPEFVLPCLGVHPIQKTGSVDEKGIDLLRSVCWRDYEGVEALIESSSGTIGGIGEIGLDFSPRFCKTSEEKESQRLIFFRQVKLAQSFDLAVNVHSRSAGNHAIKMLKEMDARKVLLHAFDGRASVAMEGASRGFYFSITASICRDLQIQKMVKLLPLSQLMVETDSPAIAPVKGELNEPVNVLISCEYIAKLKSVDVEHVKQITTENAVRVFPRLNHLINN
ncbi:hypothetical protein RRG08_020942 [Elysia crispata]|uniref:Uncharacterized protein n=1 Tax=Elysia crispata TaxID=231223 RepID=A0AAE1BBD0_9GAST|nr:hypothetical protein RRG08_020942 [Elysia crispata]